MELRLKTTIKLLAIIFVSAFVLTACSTSCKTTKNEYTGKDKKFHQNYTVEPDGKLRIELETGASIKVEGWDKNEIDIMVIFTGSSADDMEVSFNRAGDYVKVQSEYNGYGGSYTSNGSLVAKVPRNFNLDFFTAGGKVTLSDIKGELSGKTMGGKLLMENLEGNLSLKTMGGDIELTHSNVDGDVTTMGGDVDLEFVEGTVNIKTMGGDISQNNVSSGELDDGVNVKTMGGDIDIDEALNGANVKTMGGDIDVNLVNRFLNAKTMGGDIKIASADAKVNCKTMGGKIEVKFTGDSDADNRDINLTSMYGDVTLLVPKGFSMDVEVHVKVRESEADDYSVEGITLAKEVRESDSGSFHDGDNLKTVVVSKGEFNGGKNKVRISTVRSKVTIEEY